MRATLVQGGKAERGEFNAHFIYTAWFGLRKDGKNVESLGGGTMAGEKNRRGEREKLESTYLSKVANADS